jgi:hypothetical protein
MLLFIEYGAAGKYPFSPATGDNPMYISAGLSYFLVIPQVTVGVPGTPSIFSIIDRV